MRQWTLKGKLRLALALMWLGLIGVGIWSAMETRATMLDERKAGLQNLVDAAEGVAKFYHGRAQSGAMSEDEAKKARSRRCPRCATAAPATCSWWIRSSSC